jgi:PAS domain S-box-containing protein
MDPDLYIIDVSSAVPGMCGESDKTNILGKHLNKVCNVDDHTQIDQIIRKTILQHQPQVDHIKIINDTTSEYINCEVSTSVIYDEDQNPKTIILVIRDITHRELIEQQLIQQERMAVLGEMATGIAHEINQPMNIISMTIENLILTLKNEDQAKQKYIHGKSERIFENILRIRNIIDHIRNFSRDQQSYFAIQFNINDSINNAISLIDQQLQSEHIKLSCELSEELPQIKGNTYKFEQVMLNLINNSRDALEEKQELVNDAHYNKTILIRSFTEENQVCITVKDNGIGIKPEKIKQVLHPFYSSKNEGKGTGIGLSISNAIIQELRGKIELDSTFKKETTIRISIPVAMEAVTIKEKQLT